MPTGRPFPARNGPSLSKGVTLALLSLFALVALALPLGAAFAFDDYAPVSRLLRAGQPTQALAQADSYLATRPNDPQMRFLRAQALSDAGRPADAMAAYVEITQVYPELPEPHNNLAVLYARQNQLEAARASLEAAIRANPAYATAHENLGDIQLRLAAQSWARAREIQPGLASVPPKLAAARQLIQATSPASPAARAASR